MSELHKVIRRFHQREHFHDAPKLQDIIEAVRREERAKFAALVQAAQIIVETVTGEQEP